MKQSWTEGVDWFWVCVVLLTLIVMGFNTIRMHDSSKAVVACVEAKKTPILQDGQLKECK